MCAMTGMNLQSDHADRYVAETALLPAACHSLTGGSSNPPKFGTLIPNRIFVGGIPSNTTEQELKSFFSSFGQVKDVKIINDRLGVSKGSYGFVTFESQEMAEKIIKNESETLIFKDRKLNIGHAIRKQQTFPRTDLPTALFFTGGAMPYGFQDGMAVFSIPGQQYPMLTQATAPYATMMLSQPGGGTTLYIPSSLQSPAASPYAQLSQQQVAAALSQQHQYQSSNVTASINPSVAANPITPSTVNANTIGAQTNSTAALMAAAAAAMAAAVQWPQQGNGSNQPSHQLTNATAQGIQQSANAAQAVVQNASLIPQQAAAMAAAMAAQQAAWRWSPTVQQQSQNSSHTSSSTHASPSAAITTAITNSIGTTSATTTVQNLHGHQQGSPTATLGPTTYLYSPLAGAGHEVMFFQQTSSPFAANSTSDYSTDHSTHSSGMLESVEPLSFPCDGTPINRHTQQLSGQITGGFNSHPMEAPCLSPYAAFTPLLDLHPHVTSPGQQSALIHSANLNNSFRQPQHQTSATILTAQHAAQAQHFLPLAHAPTSLVPQQHAKLYSPSVISSVTHAGQSTIGVSACSLPSGICANQSLKVNPFPELMTTGDLLDSPASQTTGTGGNSCGAASQSSNLSQGTNSGSAQGNSSSNIAGDSNSALSAGTIHR